MTKLFAMADFLRVDGAGWPQAREHSLRIFRALQALRTGLRSDEAELVDWDLHAGSQVDGGRILGENGVSQVDAGWAQIYHRRTLYGPTWNALVRRLAVGIVVGFELPPVVKSALSERGIRWIDLSPSNLRFLDDQAFLCETNEPGLHLKLSRLAIPENKIWAAAASRCLASKMPKVRDPSGGREIPPTANVGLLCLQVINDRSRISDARFIALEEYSQKIQAWARKLDVVFLKPHPLEQRKNEVEFVQSILRRSIVVDGSVYDLMTTYRGSLCALSSSVLDECRFFGWTSEVLLGSIFSLEDQRGNSCVRGLGYHLITESALIESNFLSLL